MHAFVFKLISPTDQHSQSGTFKAKGVVSGNFLIMLLLWNARE